MDGEVEALNEEGKRLRDALRLNNRKNVEYRSRWMRTLRALRETQPDLYRKYMGFPEDLPDLRGSRRRVPRNTKPEGATHCYFALRERGELPATY
jgi:hypothetical protein